MKNYIELKVPVKRSASWFLELRKAMDAVGIPVKWEAGSYHITAR